MTSAGLGQVDQDHAMERSNRLGEILISQQLLGSDQLDEALNKQSTLAEKGHCYPLGRVLIGLGHSTIEQVDWALDTQQRMRAHMSRVSDAVTDTIPLPQASTGRRADPAPGAPKSAIAALRGMARKMELGDVASLLPTALGFDPLDEVLGGGLRAGELMLIGGAQGVGKTTMALQMARNIAASERAASLYICYEHDEESLLQRVLSMESYDPFAQGARLGISSRDLARRIATAQISGVGRDLFALLESDAVTRAALNRLQSYGERLLLLRGSNGTTLAAIHRIVESHRMRSELPLVVFVDYLHKIPLAGGDDSERDRTYEIVEGLKDLALTHHVPVVAVAASDVEGLRARRMRVHHLAGGSILAYEADVILLLLEKLDAITSVNIEYSPQKAATFREWVVCSVEKNRAGRDVVEIEYQKLFRYSCLDPNGRFVSEKTIDERVYKH